MQNTQVLIIGAGPVGMLAALSLAQAGIRCVIVEKRLDRLDAPKAHAVNPRTLEICERLGISADDIHAAGAPVERGGQVHFVDVLNGACFGSLPYERQDEGVLAFTPWPLVNIPQPRFEAFIAARLAQTRNVSLLRGVQAASLQQQANGVIAELHSQGMAFPWQLQADYVIAADGANSNTREQLGISMSGPEALQHYLMIHFEADLTDITREHPGLLYFCLSPTSGGVFIGYEHNQTWVFMQSYDPNTEQPANFDERRCRQLIEAAAGSPIKPLKIKQVSPWTMSAQVADVYHSGRIFLAGDAAHRFPPTGGLGLNTGVADAQNLTWKLAKVLKQQASPDLLDTYEQERRAVAMVNCDQSLTNSAKIMHLFAAVYGDDPHATQAHYTKVCENPQQHASVSAAVELQRPHFDSLNLQLGYRYGHQPDPDTIDISDYKPSFEVGDYLPRIPLQDGPWLLGQLPNQEFTLLSGPDAAGWRNPLVDVLAEDTDFKPLHGFHKCANIGTNGALLVRPDGHICARWTELPEDPEAAIRHSLGHALRTPQNTQQGGR